MTDVDTLLAAYDTHLRGESEFSSASRVERDGPVLAGVYPGGRGFVVHEAAWRAGPDEVAEVARRVVGRLVADPSIVDVEWKTRGHDAVQPALHDALLGLGFTPAEPESVMIGRAEDLVAGAPLPDGLTLRRVTAEADVRAMSAMADEVFGDPPSDRMANALLHRMAREAGSPDAMQVWVVEVDDADAPGTDDGGSRGWRDSDSDVDTVRPTDTDPSLAAARRILSCGRLEPVPGTDFAGIWGGCTRQEWRGRGLYRALLAARAREALALGRTLVQSDSTEYSRPVLARSGFTKVTTTTPYEWHRPDR